MGKFNPFDIIMGGAQMAMSGNPLIAFGLGMAKTALDQAAVPPAQHTEILQKTRALQETQILKASAQNPGLHSDVTVAPVKSAWLSKINWLAALMMVLNVGDIFNKPLPDDFKSAVMSFAQLGLPPLMIVVRTLFTKSLTKGSA